MEHAEHHEHGSTQKIANLLNIKKNLRESAPVGAPQLYKPSQTK